MLVPRQVLTDKMKKEQIKELELMCCTRAIKKTVLVLYGAENISTPMKKQFYFGLMSNTRTPIILLHTKIVRTS